RHPGAAHPVDLGWRHDPRRRRGDDGSPRPVAVPRDRALHRPLRASLARGAETQKRATRYALAARKNGDNRSTGGDWPIPYDLRRWAPRLTDMGFPTGGRARLGQWRIPR